MLQERHQNYKTTADMIHHLKEMFGEQGHQVRSPARMNLINCRVRPGTYVQEMDVNFVLNKVSTFKHQREYGQRKKELPTVPYLYE